MSRWVWFFRNLPRRVPYLIRFVRMLVANRFRSETVLFYPDSPGLDHVLYKVCCFLGYRTTTNPRAEAALRVHFRDLTTKQPDAVLQEIERRCGGVINFGCTDISKSAVDRAMVQVFGYGMAVDPRTYGGLSVRKSERNATHDGRIIQCPTEPEPGYVYQRLVDTLEGDLTMDIRVLVMRNAIPFVYLKYRHVRDRFDYVVKAQIAETADVLTTEEQRQLVAVCRALGVDYGELDVMRDRDDGRIYVADVNDTPSGPSARFNWAQTAVAVERVAAAFQTYMLAPAEAAQPTPEPAG